MLTFCTFSFHVLVVHSNYILARHHFSLLVSFASPCYPLASFVISLAFFSVHGGFSSSGSLSEHAPSFRSSCIVHVIRFLILCVCVLPMFLFFSYLHAPVLSPSSRVFLLAHSVPPGTRDGFLALCTPCIFYSCLCPILLIWCSRCTCV